jgi:hypothetical protein
MSKQRWILACVPVALSCGDPPPDDPMLSGSAEGTAGPTTEGPATGQGPGGATESAEGSATGTATTTGQAEDTTAGADGPIFDVGTIPDGGNRGCQQAACGESEWSYIWIANSNESTISKLNTRTLTEEGRYYTRPDASGNPSRTSVSIDGRAVVVANRMGGVTKINALQEDCNDGNGNGVVDTSAGGPGSMLPFANEECVAWHTPFPGATTQRPVAWTSGTYNPVTCEYDDQMVWTAAAIGQAGGTWPCTGADGIYVYRLDGETGAVLDEVHMPDVTCGGTLGPYGAAVDFNNDLWMYIWSAGTIVHVEYDTLDYETLPGGSYGITVDTSGRVWVDSGSRYDPVTGTTAYKMGNLPGSGGSGVAQDQQGRIWTATTGGVGWIDMETMVVGDTVPLPEGGLYRGIAVDFDGYIWAVLLGGTTAHKIDPDTYAVQTFNGLNSPYTYSDMAGGQLTSVTCNPPAG